MNITDNSMDMEQNHNQAEHSPISTESIVSAQRSFFRSGATIPLEFRHEALRKLKKALRQKEKEISATLQQDLGKSAVESYMAEIGMVLSDISHIDKNLDRWWKDHRVPTPLAQFHAKSYTVRNPYGVVLIMSPWNYPILLTLGPLVGAIACGNCCVVKPSAYSPATSAIISQILSEIYPPKYVTVIQGGRKENQDLLKQHFDYIFFTGGVNVGKEVMRNAAEHLTPVTLELGGKSPCIIDSTAKIDLAAKRVAFGKLLNCGQTCVAPDYVLVHQDVQEEFVERLCHHMTKMAGKQPLKNRQYVHMINSRHFLRVMGLIDPDKVVLGGYGDPESLRIEPTIMTDVTPEDAVMQEEIFGPVLPILTVSSMESAFRFVRNHPAPLAGYLFTENPKLMRRFRENLSFGGGCINDTIIHLATSEMGFGGVGNSGMGSYHGRKSIETFSHEKSMVEKSTWMDLPVRYAPYHPLQKMLLHLFLR